MSDETTLLSCPFCKGEAELKEYKPNVSGVAICKECGARSPICKNDHTGGWKSKAIVAWNTRAAKTIGKAQVEIEPVLHGTLTAEQVREAIEQYSMWVIGDNRCFHDGAYEDITDELNAKLGSGTCEFVVKDNMNESEGMGDVWIECSACHCQFDYYADDWLMKMSYCPNCSARNRKAVER